MATPTSTRSNAACDNPLTTRRLFWLIALATFLRGASIATAAGPVTTVMISGMSAPGTPNGVTFANSADSFPTVSLNDAGQVALSANLIGPGVTTSNTTGTWVGTPGHLQLLVRQGDVVNSSDGPTTWPGSTHPAINAAGQVLLDGDAIGFGTPGDFAVAAVGGKHAPGTSATTTFIPGFVNSPAFTFPVATDSGTIAFRANIVGPGISNTLGIWTGPATNLALIARSIGTLPGLPPQTITTGFGRPLINSSGSVAFAAGFGPLPTSTTGVGIWTETAGNLTPVVKEGDAAPTFPAGSTFNNLTNSISYLDYSDAGQVGFFANVIGPGVSATAGGIWTAGPTGIVPVLLDGAQAPGLPSGFTVGLRGGVQTLTLPPPMFFNHTGSVITETSLSGPGVNSGFAVWAGAPNNLKSIYYVGQQAVGFPDGVTYDGLQPTPTSWPIFPVLNDLGQVAFFSRVSTSARGIWATDREGVLHLVVKKGDLLEVTPGDFRTVNLLSFTGTGSSSGGRPTGLNNKGQIAFWASFTDGSSGVFISNAVAVPEPGTLALAAIGCAVVILRYRRRRAA